MPTSLPFWGASVYIWLLSQQKEVPMETPFMNIVLSPCNILCANLSPQGRPITHVEGNVDGENSGREKSGGGLVTKLKSCLTLATPWTVAHRLLCPWDFPGKNTRVGCHFHLQGIFPTHVLNPHLLCLLHWQVDSLPLSQQRSPKASISLGKLEYYVINTIRV